MAVCSSAARLAYVLLSSVSLTSFASALPVSSVRYRLSAVSGLAGPLVRMRGGLHHVGFTVVPALLETCPVSNAGHVEQAGIL